MSTVDEKVLSNLLLSNVTLRNVEPNIYSVLATNEEGNTYDNKFGTFYDLVACNPIYNRIIWGYSTSKFSSLVDSTIRSSAHGTVLDIGCGSLAFTAKTYIRYSDRPVVLADQSLKLLRIAKARLIKLHGKVPDNMVFLHADALQLPFVPKAFNTIISLNLLHVLDDINNLLNSLRNVLSEDGEILFTTLVKGDRLADKYLKVWEDAGEVISRNVHDLETIFEKTDLSITYDLKGNMAFIKSQSTSV